MNILSIFRWWRRFMGGRWRRGDVVEDHGYREDHMSPEWMLDLKNGKLDSVVVEGEP